MPPGVKVRLDALLARATGQSRSAVQRLARPLLGKALRKPVFDGQRLSLSALNAPRR